MSGFSQGAIDSAQDIGKEHAVVLIDGEEITNIIMGGLRLESVLEAKIRYFERYGDPFYKVKI